jgi:DNA segregation ATPase FtsK/SpoIIIE-like protein
MVAARRRGFLYLALILATYSRNDAGWSSTGTGAPIANRGGAVGAWLSDLLLYLFGFSAWWWVVGGVVLVIAGYRRVVHPIAQPDHPFAFGLAGFALVLLSSAALESIRLYGFRRHCRSGRAERSANSSVTRCSEASASTAPRCCCLRCSRSARRFCSACHGCA